ncbi:MAG: sucrase ferredoxin, partial [Ilumatobacteraceae bacterium]
TWECSHLGGDRFAGNLLVLPDGLTYGRLDADSGPGVAAEHLDGRLDLAHLRGRAGYGFATQAAEWHLRQRVGLADLAGLRLEAESVRDDLTTCVFVVASGRWTVVVRSSRADAAQLTCQSTVRRHALQCRLESIDVLPEG